MLTYKEQITKVYDGHLSKSWSVGSLAPFHVAGDVLTGIGHAPADYFVHSRRFYRAIRRQPPCYLNVQTQDVENVTCPDDQFVNFVNNHDETGDALIYRDRNVVIDVDRAKVDASQLEIARFIQYTALWPVRLISTPLAHGLGEAAWQNMLRRTRTTIRRSIEHYLDRHGYKVEREAFGKPITQLVGDASGCPNDFREKQKYFPQGTGVFAMFFEMLRRHHHDDVDLPKNVWVCEGDDESKLKAEDRDAKAREKDERISEVLQGAEITLIGHSMGAIVINELLSRFPTLPYSDVVMMAAASSVRDTRATIDQYFSQNTAKAKNTRFYSLMLHPLNDTRERQYYGAVPSGSLLMWIDEMYEVPKVPDDKTFGFWPNAKSSRDYFSEEARDRTLYRIFNRPDPHQGEPANPMTHGAFNDDETCFWRPTFWGVRNTEWAERYQQSMPDQALEECNIQPEPKEASAS